MFGNALIETKHTCIQNTQIPFVCARVRAFVDLVPYVFLFLCPECGDANDNDRDSTHTHARSCVTFGSCSYKGPACADICRLFKLPWRAVVLCRGTRSTHALARAPKPPSPPRHIRKNGCRIMGRTHCALYAGNVGGACRSRYPFNVPSGRTDIAVVLRMYAASESGRLARDIMIW